jgi:hypothetical protein
MSKEDDGRGDFLRHCLTVTGVFESICCHCGKTVANSPDMGVLQLAEGNHVCAAAPKVSAASRASNST